MRAPCLAGVLALVALARPAGACATAPPLGVEVRIADESAIILWDAAAHREHFIRRASFRGTGQDFGFLVPTPAKPELAEVSDAAFYALEQAVKPEVVHETVTRGVEPTLFCASLFLLRAGLKASPAPAPVRVLDAQRVGGYDAVVLEADDAGALARWLQEHGYAQRPELAAWLEPYVTAKWKVTAFKIAPERDAHAVETAGVRMSFATERPFFPYREPADQRERLPSGAAAPERLLRIFFIGTERVDGVIGAAGAPWPGRAIWSDRYDAERDGLLPTLMPKGAWLTMFEDRSSPRPGTDDLYFVPGRERGPVKPPPVVETDVRKVPLPLDLILGGGVSLAVLVRRARRRAAG